MLAYLLSCCICVASRSASTLGGPPILAINPVGAVRPVPPVTGPVPIQPALVGHGPVAVIERPLPHGCANGVASSQSCPGTMPKSHYFNGGSAAISTGWAPPNGGGVGVVATR
jgi:hypothetical protein